MSKTDILNLRKELHQHPELSCFEFETAKRIRQFIKKHDPTAIIENVGKTGLAVVYDYKNKGAVIIIRCELDALPIEEENQFGHKSKHKGISHKCGHDGHMAIVSGLVFWLKYHRFDAGKIILLFQPAEENGKGAIQIIEDKKFIALKPDYVFALHNIPNEPLHDIILMKQGFSAEVQSFIIRVKGKESHASEPENGINPALGLSKLIALLSSLNVPNQGDKNFAILTPIHIHMGQIAYGVSPADGELHYTARTWSTDKMSTLKIEIKDMIKQTCQTYNLEYDVEWLEYFPASNNDKQSNNFVSAAAKENNYNIIERPYPFKFGEDFGWFSKKYKTAMFGLGAGINTPALHHADYDFPDEIIPTGISMFRSIIETILKK